MPELGARQPAAAAGNGRDGAARHEITFVPAQTEAEAAAVGFAGSPTFMVDGIDLFGHRPGGGSLTCRVYVTPGGLAGVPTVDDLVRALREADR
jgi:hypothetical protein